MVAVLIADTPEALFHAVRMSDPARPVVTFYDRASGERAELSAASLGNWVAKGHFLLGDELGLGPGDAAYVEVGVHWMTVAIWMAVYTAGLALTADAADAQVAFAEASSLAEGAGTEPAAARAAPDVYAVALLAWGAASPDPPAGTTDYVSAVRPQPDAWASVRRPAGPGDRATDSMTRVELVRAGRARALELGLAPSARVLLTDRGNRSLSIIDLVAVLSVNGSLVLVRHADLATDDAVIAQERVTATI